MRKIKIFRVGVFNDVRVINEWLAEHKSAIIDQMLQSESNTSDGWSLTITIFYYEGEQGDAK